MNMLLSGAAVFLLANLIVGLVRVYRGPDPANRVLALLLFGTTTVATLLLLTYRLDVPGLLQVALVFVLLAAIAAIAFVRLPPSAADQQPDGRD